MLEESTIVQSEPAGQSTTHVVHALMQFLMAVRYRKNVLAAALVVAGLLGGLYYATATPRYEASGALFVMRTGPDSRTAPASRPIRYSQRSLAQ